MEVGIMIKKYLEINNLPEEMAKKTLPTPLNLLKERPAALDDKMQIKIMQKL